MRSEFPARFSVTSFHHSGTPSFFILCVERTIMIQRRISRLRITAQDSGEVTTGCSVYSSRRVKGAANTYVFFSVLLYYWLGELIDSDLLTVTLLGIVYHPTILCETHKV